MSSSLLVLPEFIPVAVVVMAMVATWVCWIVIEWVWLKPKLLERCLRKQGLSGNSYRIFYGDLNYFSKLREEAHSKPMSFTNNILPRVKPQIQPSLLHGKNPFVWMGPIPMVHITQPELIREVLTKMGNFGKPKLSPINTLLAPGLAKYDGEKWTKHRKMLNPAFYIENLKFMVPAFYSSCDEMINTWETMLGEMGSIELDIWPYLRKLAGDVISRVAFGSSFEEGERIFELLKEQVELTIKILQKPEILGFRFIPGKIKKRTKMVNKEIESLLAGIIEKRKKDMQATKGDLLDILMENAFGSEMYHKNQLVGMTMGELIDECKLFYFGGHETSAALLVWTIIMLSKHQDWQEQAREEVFNAFGKNKPDFDGLNQLKKMTAILYEVLRLYPPIVEITRMTKHKVQLGNLCLPADVMINLPIMLVHHDPELWGDDVLEFKPERFSEGIVKATRGNNAFFPFGWGPRICIGQNFALLEVKLALAIVLQRLSFELPPSYSHAPSALISLEPQFGAHIVLKKL